MLCLALPVESKRAEDKTNGVKRRKMPSREYGYHFNLMNRYLFSILFLLSTIIYHISKQCFRFDDLFMATPFLLSNGYSLCFFLILRLIFIRAAQSDLCRTSYGNIPINYPFSIDEGCGSPYYLNILVCTNASTLELRTPSGRYPARSMIYTDPHLVVTDPYMWSCNDGVRFRRTRPFSLDTSTRFTLSTQNDSLLQW